MRIHIAGGSDAALALGGALASFGHELSTDADVPLLRLALPSGWLSVAVRSSGSVEGADILLHGGSVGEPARAAARRSVLVRSGDSWAMETAELAWVALFDVLRDGPGELELVEGSAGIVVPQEPEYRRLLAPLGKLGIRLEEARSTQGHAASLAALRLLDLPIALCNTTREAFLSLEEGRRVGEAVLDEGVRLAEKLWGPLERIGTCDPRELLQDIRRRPASFAALRNLPGRRYPRLLQALLRGGNAAELVPQRGMVRRAREVAMPADWNWRMLQLLPRVGRAGFFGGPADLLRAMG